MKILNEEHLEKVKRYAESIGDTSFRHCLDSTGKAGRRIPDHPSEISLYYDHAPYSFGFTQRYPDGRTGIVGGLLYHGIPDRSFAVTLEPFHGWQIHTWKGKTVHNKNNKQSNSINFIKFKIMKKQHWQYWKDNNSSTSRRTKSK